MTISNLINYDLRERKIQEFEINLNNSTRRIEIPLRAHTLVISFYARKNFFQYAIETRDKYRPYNSGKMKTEDYHTFLDFCNLHFEKTTEESPPTT
jgi:hypothetical protein